jgi:hypothetical protein
MKCPRDGSEMQIEQHEAGFEVDVCPTCQGQWLESTFKGGCPIPPRPENARSFGAHPQSSRFASPIARKHGGPETGPWMDRQAEPLPDGERERSGRPEQQRKPPWTKNQS